jgi:hypothetical protein
MPETTLRRVKPPTRPLKQSPDDIIHFPLKGLLPPLPSLACIASNMLRRERQVQHMTRQAGSIHQIGYWWRSRRERLELIKYDRDDERLLLTDEEAANVAEAQSDSPYPRSHRVYSSRSIPSWKCRHAAP